MSAEVRRLSDEECYELFRRYHTPDRVIRHCQAVSYVAETISGELNRAGHSYDLALVHSAGLIHDVLRTDPDHAKAGGDLLVRMGYPDEARIVYGHMRHLFVPLPKTDELDMVCLGDRLVVEDEYAGLDRRIDYLIHKKGENPARTAALLAGKKQIRRFIDEVEREIGKPVDSLFSH